MKRSAGVLMHISSLWGDYSGGSFGAEAREWIDFLAESGFSVWQTLPFCMPDAYCSPYASFSAFSVNPFFIDLPTLYDEGLLTAAELEAARQDTPYVCEFDRLQKERVALLALAASRFQDDAALAACMKDHPQTDHFCRFMALRVANNEKPWLTWDSSVSPDPATLRTWRFIVYTFLRQWKAIKAYANEKGISIIGDVPIYVAFESADVWANREQFLLNRDGKPSAVAGVPPDYFCEDGQLWGNPLYDWKKMKADGYAWWRARMRLMCEWFDGVRIDHFRGLESYYSIPAGETTARNGTWVKGPGIGFIKALREECGEKLLIAEDLGDITPAVARLVEKSGCPGMRVFQFAFLGDPNSPHLPHNYPHHCVAYTGTHDNNTLLGYVWELDSETRKRMFAYCGYDAPESGWEEGYDAILRTMFSSHADLLILPIQDLLLYGCDTRLNRPGTDCGNWSYRLTKQQLDTLSPAKFRTWICRYGRMG